MDRIALSVAVVCVGRGGFGSRAPQQTLILHPSATKVAEVTGGSGFRLGDSHRGYGPGTAACIVCVSGRGDDEMSEAQGEIRNFDDRSRNQESGLPLATLLPRTACSAGRYSAVPLALALASTTTGVAHVALQRPPTPYQIYCRPSLQPGAMLANA